MAYKYDKDLEFLGECSDQQLAKLAEIIIKDDDGKFRRTEEVTETNEYKRYKENYSKYWETIVGDFQKFGGNTIANWRRGGKGIEYNEILNDILGSSFSNLSVFEKEKELLKRAFSIILSESDQEKRRVISKEINFEGATRGVKTIMNFIEQKINDINFDYKITNIILNSITTKRIDYSLIKEFDTHSTFEGTNIINSIVPIWVINLGLGEARRVTIPASIVIACLRKLLNYEKNNREV
jgi:putative uncharacterized protein FNV1995